jgi:PIN domain nuclease of toxin-antitoxin system
VRLLLDTNIVIAIVEERTGKLPRDIRAALVDKSASAYASVASLWEIAIKCRLGKLPLRVPLGHLPAVLAESGTTLLAIEASHALAHAEPEPATRDPFDRILLSQCLVEGMRLVTLDRALAAHPLAWRPA